MLHVKMDADGWYRIARNNKILPSRPPFFDNIYFTRTGALAGIRAIKKQRGGERRAHAYVR